MQMEAMFHNKTFSSSTQKNSTSNILFSYDVIIITERDNKSKKKRRPRSVST